MRFLRYSTLILFLASPLAAQVPVLPSCLDVVGTLDRQQAQALFRQFCFQDDLALHAPQDGCFARCHLMCIRLRQMGVQVRRAWAFPQPKTRLHARAIGAKSGVIEWDWHVAPLVPMRVGDQVEWVVFDPCLFTRPVSLEEWAHALRKDERAPLPSLAATQLGEPPTRHGKRLTGTGYWTAADPGEGPTAHAVKTLRGYGKPKAPAGAAKKAGG